MCWLVLGCCPSADESFLSSRLLALLVFHFSISSVVRVGIFLSVVGACGAFVEGVTQPSFLKMPFAERPPNSFSRAAPFMVLSSWVMFSTGIRHHLQPLEDKTEKELKKVKRDKMRENKGKKREAIHQRDKMSTYCKTAVDVFPNEIVEV